MFILYFLGIILLIIIFILAVLILTPYTYVIKGDNFENQKMELSVSCFFEKLGFTFIMYSFKDTEARFNIFQYSNKINFKHTPKDKKDEKKKEKKKNNEKKSKKWTFFLTFQLIQEVKKLMNKILKEVLPKKYLINVKIGFSDPMHTGVLLGVSFYLRSLYELKNIFLEPVFYEETLQFKGFIQGRIWFVKIIGDVLKFIIAAPVRKQIFSIMKK